MKKIAISLKAMFCICIFLDSVGGSFAVDSPPKSPAIAHKRALLVAINIYHHKENDPWDLHSDTDVERLKLTLISKFGFSQNDIVVMNKPETTTHAAIVDAFQKLINSTQKGDLVYFHYSGHGSQIEDTQIKHINGLSSALVPSDYNYDGKPPYNQITNVELRDLVKALDDKEPLLATLSFDCCYAGAPTRGRHVSRGFSPTRIFLTKPPINVSLTSAPRDLYQPGNTIRTVILSACRPDQEAWETDWDDGHSGGLFTYSLVKAFREAGAKTTYRDVIERVKVCSAEKQSDGRQQPEFDGLIDNILLSGTALPPQKSFRIHRNDKGVFVMDAGELQNITANSKFDVFPLDTKDFKDEKPLGNIRVEHVSLTSSVMSESQPPSTKLNRLNDGRAVESEHSYENAPKLKLLNATATNHQMLHETLSEAPDLLVIENSSSNLPWDVRLDDAGSEVKATRSDGTIVFSGTVSSVSQAARLRKALEADIRWNYLRKLENDNPRSLIKVDARLVEVKVVAKDKDSDLVTAVTPAEAVQGSVPPVEKLVEGKYFGMEFRNKGYAAAYLNIFDLQPDGSVKLLYPAKDIHVQFSLPADGTWHRLPCPYVFDIEEPFGQDLYKVIATAQPEDLSLLESDGQARGPATIKSPLQNLIVLGSQGSRGSGISRSEIKPENWSASTMTLKTEGLKGEPKP